MKTSIDILPTHRQILLSLARQIIPGVAVWIYGSRVKGTSRPESDLDLVVVSPYPNRRAISDFKDALDESNLPFVTDLHIWNDLPAPFRRNIIAHHLVLQPPARQRSRSSRHKTSTS